MTTASRQSRDLQLEEDLGFERSESRAARALWLLLLLVIVAAALGAFGRGPLSRTHVILADGLSRVHYERFARFGASTRIVVEIQPAAEAGAVEFLLGRSYLDSVSIDAITPQPTETRLEPDGVRYRFPARGEDAVQVLFDVVPVRRWRIHGSVAVGASTGEWMQFVYP